VLARPGLELDRIGFCHRTQVAKAGQVGTQDLEQPIAHFRCDQQLLIRDFLARVQ
jgi:hypothetical protein